MPSQDGPLQESLMEKWMKQPKREFFKARTSNSSDRTGLLAGCIVIGSAAVFLGPWLINELGESTGQQVRLAPPSVLPQMSPIWWDQMWRRGSITQDLILEGQFQPNFDFVKSVTGIAVGEPQLPRRPSEPHARALVPLCGGSMVMKHLVEQGYEVDAVDSSETALRVACERNETGLDRDLYHRLHLHWSDIFAPQLWNSTLKGRRYNFIYERQGITSIDRSLREDYAFLLKRALHPDGIIFVEAVFRTGRVAGNKDNGPPFSLSRSDLKALFPESEGYLVKCGDAVDNAVTKLDRESRILRRVPKELYVTTYPCAVAKKEMFLLSAGGSRPDSEKPKAT
jgi:hypothetical protein